MCSLHLFSTPHWLSPVQPYVTPPAHRDADHLYLVLELASGGELFSHIKRLGSCHLNCARFVTAELINALAYLHSRRVVHRDLKPGAATPSRLSSLLEGTYLGTRLPAHSPTCNARAENVLLDDAGHIKLVDFGSARRLDADDDAPRFVGTAEYVSPEVLDDQQASPTPAAPPTRRALEHALTAA